ncbi:hypothetical protein [Paenibacillus sp. N3.4]|uniref:hypothetical protein n=1 Tax=Paenibacillus sp. N3.4 TaxID=2603222 RepID=UPI0011C92E13|nr:hypothetical protein [Paenibacillus sp. N3.4]TXK82571.1 hypothetical protein FU659_14650 [Paenibacillus sp. N3.4]
MAAKVKSNKETVIDQDSWLEMIYKLLSENELRKIATIIQPQIQGFTAKNLVKAPLAMLRKKTIEKLRQNMNKYIWMKKWFEPTVSKVKEEKINFEEFYHRSRLGDHVTPAEAVAITGILYPEMFNENKNTMQQNIEGKKHPLEDLGTKKLAPKRQLQVKALAWEDSSAKEAYRLLIQESLGLKLELEGSVKDWVQEKSSVEIGEISYLASTKMEEINKWTEGEKAAFFQMAFHDSQKVIWKMIEDLLKEKSELEKEDKAKEKKLKKLEKHNTEREEVEMALKRQMTEMEKKLAEADNEYEKSVAELQDEIECLRQQQGAREQVAAAQVMDEPLLVTESEFVLVTRFNQEEYASMLPIGQIIHIQDVSDFLDCQLEDDVKYIFIHSDCFTSKEQFYLDEIVELFERPFKSVSGSSAAVTRQIIYYLEGAIINEINT